MEAKPDMLIVGYAPGAVLLVATPAVCCPECKRAASIVVNARGRTTCAACAPTKEVRRGA